MLFHNYGKINAGGLQYRMFTTMPSGFGKRTICLKPNKPAIPQSSGTNERGHFSFT